MAGIMTRLPGNPGEIGVMRAARVHMTEEPLATIVAKNGRWFMALELLSQSALPGNASLVTDFP